MLPKKIILIEDIWDLKHKKIFIPIYSQSIFTMSIKDIIINDQQNTITYYIFLPIFCNKFNQEILQNLLDLFIIQRMNFLELLHPFFAKKFNNTNYERIFPIINKNIYNNYISKKIWGLKKNSLPFYLNRGLLNRNILGLFINTKIDINSPVKLKKLSYKIYY